AEDGIRDFHVTGVQTCALPIYRVDLVYNKFKNAATQIIMCEQFLPIVPMEGDSSKAADHIHEPSKGEIVEQLIPKSLKTQLFKEIGRASCRERVEVAVQTVPW